MTNALDSLLKWLFQPPGELAGRQSRVRGAFLFGLYLLGLAHWAFFFGNGHFALDFHDWPKEVGYFAVLEQAIEQGKVPLHISPAIVTDRFLANPEVPLSPQVLLLPRIGDGTFVLLNTALMYSLGFVGLLHLSRRSDLSPAGFTALYLLFNFNGSLTSHLAVGHSMWVGYFLIPFFLTKVLELVDSRAGQLWAAGLGLTLFGMLLVGAFHFVVWCVLFLVLLGLSRPPLGRQIWGALVLALALGAFRILPATLEFAAEPRPFVGGFQSTWDLLEGLAAFKTPFQAVLTRVGPPDWWEVDYYIGWGGLAILASWAVTRAIGVSDPKRPPALEKLAPALVAVALLSLDPILRLISKLPIPLIGAERVASRFFVVPFLFMILIAVQELNRALQARTTKKSIRLAGLALLGFTTLDLWQHSRLWRVDQVRLALDPRPPEPLPTIQQLADPGYTTALVAGALISLVGLGVCAWLALRSRSAAAVSRKLR